MSPEQMRERLVQAFPQAIIEVRDLTGGQDHYEVYISSDVFAPMNRIQRHKTVMNVFDAELKSGEVHALTIQAEVPQKET